KQQRQNANPEYAVYHDLLNIILYTTRKNAEDFQQGIKMTLISYATAIMAKEGTRAPNCEPLENALKAMEMREKDPAAADFSKIPDK
ncbi:MAG: hypothetical protein LBJ21_08035, partial [Acidobacteriota bacterium]|nr:hypothetical protein [Acidobacteriota bacterium]